MSKIVDYVSEDNKNDMLNDVRDSDYDAFVKLSQVFELNVFCPVHMEGEKDWVVAYLMNDAVESFLVFKDSVMTVNSKIVLQGKESKNLVIHFFI